VKNLTIVSNNNAGVDWRGSRPAAGDQAGQEDDLVLRRREPSCSRSSTLPGELEIEFNSTPQGHPWPSASAPGGGWHPPAPFFTRHRAPATDISPRAKEEGAEFRRRALHHGSAGIVADPVDRCTPWKGDNRGPTLSIERTARAIFKPDDGRTPRPKVDVWPEVEILG